LKREKKEKAKPIFSRVNSKYNFAKLQTTTLNAKLYFE